MKIQNVLLAGGVVPLLSFTSCNDDSNTDAVPVVGKELINKISK